jgi:hypothetical protein
MSMRKISCLSAWASGALAAAGLLIGSSGRAAAAEPTTAADARICAQDSAARAEQYKAMGAVGYKTGLVQREEADAARYQALADKLAAEEPTVTAVVVTTSEGEPAAVGVVVTPPASPVLTPKEEQAAADVAHYQAMGGAAYKTGMVQAAEAEQRRTDAAGEPVVPAPSPNPICLTSKPVVTLECERAASTQ